MWRDSPTVPNRSLDLENSASNNSLRHVVCFQVERKANTRRIPRRPRATARDGEPRVRVGGAREWVLKTGFSLTCKLRTWANQERSWSRLKSGEVEFLEDGRISRLSPSSSATLSFPFLLPFLCRLVSQLFSNLFSWLSLRNRPLSYFLPNRLAFHSHFPIYLLPLLFHILSCLTPLFSVKL